MPLNDASPADPAHPFQIRENTESAPDTARYQRSTMLDSLWAHAPTAVIAYDAQGRVEHWNPAAEAIFGWKEAEVLGKQPPLVQTEERHVFFEVLHRTLLGEAIGERDATRIRKDGSEVKIRIWTAPLRDSESVIRGMVAILVDVTERLRTEEALARESEAKNELLDASRTARVVPWSQLVAGGPVRLGESALEVLGVQGGEQTIQPAKLHEAMHPEDVRAFHRARKAAARGQVASFECRMRRTDGGWFASRWTLGRRHGRFQGVIQDVDAFAALREQLFESQKLENLGAVVGGLAHDFKNLLTAILGYADFLSQDKALKDSHQHGLQVITRSAEQCNQLIIQILGLSRPTEAQRVSHDLNQTVKEFGDLLPHILRPGIHLEVQIQEGLPKVFVDPGQIHQVVMNLVLNARDAMKGPGCIILRTGLTESRDGFVVPGPHAFIEVEDDGTGMPPEVMARIFEPFFSTKGPGEGTGLGLAVVKGIVTKHHGVVHAHSEAGRGARFLVAFPVLSSGLSAL